MQWKITITTQSKNKESWEKRKNQNKKLLLLFLFVSNTNNYVVGLGYTVVYYLYFFLFTCSHDPLDETSNSTPKEISHHTVIDNKVVMQNTYYQVIDLKYLSQNGCKKIVPWNWIPRKLAVPRIVWMVIGKYWLFSNLNNLSSRKWNISVSVYIFHKLPHCMINWQPNIK